MKEAENRCWFEYRVLDGGDTIRLSRIPCEISGRRTDAAPSTANAKIKNHDARLQMRAYVARAFRSYIVAGQ